MIAVLDPQGLVLGHAEDVEAGPHAGGGRAVRPREFRVSSSRRAFRNKVPQVERKGPRWRTQSGRERRCSNAGANLRRTPRGGSPGVRPQTRGSPTIRRRRGDQLVVRLQPPEDAEPSTIPRFPHEQARHGAPRPQLVCSSTDRFETLCRVALDGGTKEGAR